MRSFFGLAQDQLALAVAAVSLAIVLGLAWVALRHPLLLRVAWRNVPRRPGFSMLITLGLTIGTVILSTAFTTGDTMSQSVRTVVAGVLGASDEVVFVPSASQPAGFDLGESIASGTLLTGLTDFFPASRVEDVRRVLDGDDRVAALIPTVLVQKPAAGASGLRLLVNVLGVPGDLPDSDGLRDVSAGRVVAVGALASDEVYVNQEAATTLNVRAGDTLTLLELGADSRTSARVRDVVRVGDLGGAQATIFMPIERLQVLAEHEDQVNQVLVLNRGDGAARLAASWPITVKLRAAFLDDGVTARLFQRLSAPVVREGVQSAANRATAQQGGDKLRALAAALAQPGPTDEFKALVQDPEVLSRIASDLRGAVRRGNRGPLSATLAGGSDLHVLDVQRIAQQQADVWGTAFTQVFVVLGLFSLGSGVLLIVLVFSLLALERRSELGILRALGGGRRDVVLILALEGLLYSVVSAAFGLVAGLGVAFGLIAFASGLVEQYGFHLQPTVQPASLGVAYGVGVLLTFVAVTLTAWWSSRFSIVTAVRDQPDPAPGAPSRRSLTLLVAVLLTAAGLVEVGARGRLALAYAGGIALSIVATALVGRWLLRRGGVRGAERVVFTVAGLLLVSWWMLPHSWLRALHVPAFPATLEIVFLSGMAMLLGAVWLVAYNAGLLRLLRGGGSLWRLSTAYVASHRFRTGLTLAMFGLVVLGLTLASSLLASTSTAYADPGVAGGGWDIRAESSRPLRDITPDLPDAGTVAPDAVQAIGGTAPYAVDAIQVNARFAVWSSASVLAVDPGFASAVQTSVSGSAHDSRSAWQELTSRPGTAVVGEALLRGDASSSALRVEVPASGPAVLWIRDARGGQPPLRVEVVGFADARSPFASSVLVGQQTLAVWPAADRSVYYVSVAPGVSPRESAAAIGFAVPDLRASAIDEQQRLIQGVRGLLDVILRGFMGIGLLAGIAALGTLSTRAVVERRREVGVLRALGFSARAVGLGLLVETTLVALLGTALGVSVGLYVARATVELLGRQSPELRLVVPWLQLVAIAVVALAASLAMTLLPARAAARLSPAEALRDA